MRFLFGSMFGENVKKCEALVVKTAEELAALKL